MKTDIDVLIPARKASVGLPGKNKRVLVDRPLALHSVACAQQLKGVRRIYLSTDDPQLATAARKAGAYVPSLRPADLASGTTPTAAVVRHALSVLEEASGTATDYLLLLEPTSPLRDPNLIDQAAHRLRSQNAMHGAISISEPSFNPLWVGVEVQEGGRISRHPETPKVFARRQDVPAYWRINGNFYLWRTEFARGLDVDWLDQGAFIGIETPDLLGHSIDDLSDFRLVEALLDARLVSVPWLGGAADT